MAQKNSRRGFRRYAIIGSASVAGLVGVLLTLTYVQPQRQDIIQDKPLGVAGPQPEPSLTSQNYLLMRVAGRQTTTSSPSQAGQRSPL